MGHKLAFDFGTTNSVIARLAGEQAEIIHIPALSTANEQALIPSLLYVRDGQDVIVGQAAMQEKPDHRLFRNFKRGIVATRPPEPRYIDGEPWRDSDAGRLFIQKLIAALPDDDIDQLVLTVPVAAFQGYLDWLNHIMEASIASEKIRVVDESTAAALGYAVTEPGAVVLVFDFGGGTLDLSLVQLPETRETTGGFLRRLIGGSPNQHAARVIAKAGQVIGGSDIDQWLLQEVLKCENLSSEQLGDDYAALLAQCEAAKIALSTEVSTELIFTAAGKTHTLTITRAELESLLTENGFFDALNRVVNKVMTVARQRGIFKEDIHYVLLVGGISLMPCVQECLKDYFTDMAVRADKPFTAVVEGALQVAAGYGLDDYLIHSYGLRYLDPISRTHQYDEILPMGSSLPITTPVEVILGAAHEKQDAVELVIGEIDTDTAAVVEVRYENGQTVFVAGGDGALQNMMPLNADTPLLAPLKPNGKPGVDRLKAAFTVDERRQLRVTVTDIKTKKALLRDEVLVMLR